MRIGELANSTETPVRTIRYYEEIGLLSRPERSASGYRIFTGHHLHQLRFIRAARALGLRLVQVREILDAASEQPSACGCVRDTVERNIVEIDQRMAALQSMRDALERTLSRIDHYDDIPRSSAICPAIESVPSPRHSTTLDSPVDWRV